MTFAEGGWNVGLIARGTTGLRAAAASIAATGARACWAESDVADAWALARAADDLVDQLGQLDVWINCAGVGTYGVFGDIPAADYDRVTAVTYGGTVNGCRIALRIMQANGFGTIINICSAVAFHGLPLMTSYAGAKAAVRGFGQALQAELRIARSPIRLCTVFPPAINTPFFAHSKSYMGRPARPAPPVYQPEVIAAAIYLAASRSGSELRVTGTVLAFSWAQRAFPWLIAFAMTRLGFEGQLSPAPATAAGAQETTLFAPSDAPSQMRGATAPRARRWSAQVWLAKAIARLGRRTAETSPRETGGAIGTLLSTARMKNPHHARGGARG